MYISVLNFTSTSSARKVQCDEREKNKPISNGKLNFQNNRTLFAFVYIEFTLQ